MPKKSHSASDSAITGAGAVTAGTGVVAGGVPGKSSAGPLIQRNKERSSRPKPVGVRARVTNAKDATRAGVKAGRGGIFGFRVSNHEGGNYGFKQQATMSGWYPKEKPKDAYKAAIPQGKVVPEEKIIRQMKGGKKAAGAAMLAGASAIAYGQRSKFKKSQSSRERLSGAAIGTGGAGLAISGGVGHVLGREQKKWAKSAAKGEEIRGRLIPRAKGMSSLDIERNPKVFDNVSRSRAVRAGQVTGATKQAKYFAHVYGTTGKVVRSLRAPSAAVAAVGAGGLAMSRKKDKIKKNLSAFGVEH